MGVIFRWIQNRLEGTGFRKGGQFGLALGGMYLVGMIEGYALFPFSANCIPESPIVAE